jgi:Holliday junction resolvase RusA-like endonuclease
MNSDYEVEFSVEGVPVGQGSLRHVGNGRLVHTAKLITWREKVVEAVQDQAQLTDMVTGPVCVIMHFRVPHLTTRAKWPSTRSSHDLDKLVRAIGDALTMGGLIEDDSRIIKLQATKRYDDNPGVTIKLGRVWD